MSINRAHWNKNDPTYMAPRPTGRILNVFGDRCYAYSGSTYTNNVVTPMLNFNSGQNFLEVKLSFHSQGISNDDYNQIISFNDVTIVDQTVPQTYQSTATGYQPIDLIIPPFTDFKITFQNVTDTSSNYWSVLLTGKVLHGDDAKPTLAQNSLL